MDLPGTFLCNYDNNTWLTVLAVAVARRGGTSPTSSGLPERSASCLPTSTFPVPSICPSPGHDGGRASLLEDNLCASSWGTALRLRSSYSLLRTGLPRVGARMPAHFPERSYRTLADDHSARNKARKLTQTVVSEWCRTMSFIEHLGRDALTPAELAALQAAAATAGVAAAGQVLCLRERVWVVAMQRIAKALKHPAWMTEDVIRRHHEFENMALRTVEKWIAARAKYLLTHPLPEGVPAVAAP